MLGIENEKESLSDTLEKLDEKADSVRLLMERASSEDLKTLWDQIDISAVYHDCALEGQVTSPEELNAAFDPRAITDATNLSLFVTLRRHKQAYELIRKFASGQKITYDLSLFKQFHALFASDPVAAHEGRFRQDIPLHRSYFHEINNASKIESQMEILLEWLEEGLGGERDYNSMHPIVYATTFHGRFMHIFPFAETSGKIARAVMNLILVQSGYLPAIIHATDRQRYYEVLKQSKDGLVFLVIESARASLDAAVRFLRRIV